MERSRAEMAARNQTRSAGTSTPVGQGSGAVATGYVQGFVGTTQAQGGVQGGQQGGGQQGGGQLQPGFQGQRVNGVGMEGGV